MFYDCVLRIVPTTLCFLMVLMAEAEVLANDEADWHVIVEEDIWLEHACRVAFFSHIVERESESGRVVMVKVHCEDSRSFDAVQFGAEMPFEFNECTPHEKTSC